MEDTTRDGKQCMQETISISIQDRGQKRETKIKTVGNADRQTDGEEMVDEKLYIIYQYLARKKPQKSKLKPRKREGDSPYPRQKQSQTTHLEKSLRNDHKRPKK